MCSMRCSIIRVRSRPDGTTPMAVAIPTMSLRYAVCLASSSRRASRISSTAPALQRFGKPSTYPALEAMIAGRINVALIRAHWSEILRASLPRSAPAP